MRLKTALIGHLIKPLKFLILIALLIAAGPINGQTNLDSLYHIWDDESQTDTSRVKAYLKYVYDYYVLQKPDSALWHLDKALNFCSEHRLPIWTVQTQKYKGYHYFRIGEYDKAIKTYDEGLALAKVQSDSLGLAQLLLRKGWIYHDNGQKIKAINNYKKALSYFEQLKDEAGKSSVYNELGSIYRDEEEWDKALEYYKKAIASAEKANTPPDAPLSNMGFLYCAKEEYDSALVYMLPSYEKAQKANDKLVMASDLVMIAKAYRGLGNTEIAGDYLQKALEQSYEINDAQRIVICLLEMAEYEMENKDFDSAKSHCEKALVYSKSLGDLDDLYYISQCLYETNKALGNPTLALKYAEEMNMYEDSLEMKETNAALMKMEFNSKLKADSIAQSQKEIEHKEEITKSQESRNLYLIGGLVFLFLSAGLYLRNRRMKVSKNKLQEEMDKSESLLLKVLPADIAKELKETGKIKPRNFDRISILFTDFKEFTKKSAVFSSELIVKEIDECFEAFDNICEKHKIEKIKTIGDAYMAAGGLKSSSPESVKNTVLAGLEMQAFIIDRLKNKKGEIPFEMRVGINTGTVTGGVVGTKKYQFDLWGDTVNIASRVEENGEVNRLNISESTYSFIQNEGEFVFDDRGAIDVKGKGELQMYFVDHKPSFPFAESQT